MARTHSAQCDHVAVVLEQGSGGELEVEDILPAHDPFGQFALVRPLAMELQGRGISLFHLAGCLTGGHATDYIRRRCTEIVARPFHNDCQFLIHISLCMTLFFIDKDRSIRTSPPLLFQRPGTVHGPATNPDNRLTMTPSSGRPQTNRSVFITP